MLNYRSLLLTIALLFFAHNSMYGQRTLGIKWHVPEKTDSAIAQLQKFHEVGISVVEIESELSPRVWQQIDSLQIKVYGSFGIRFPVASTFKQLDSALVNNIQNKASVYLSEPSVTAIGLFEFGAINNPSFVRRVKPIVDQLKKSGQRKLYYTSGKEHQSPLADFILFNFNINPENINRYSVTKNSAIGGYVFSPSDDLKNYLKPFKSFLEATSDAPAKPVFVHSDWLLSLLNKHGQLSGTLQAISSEPGAVFPLPRENVPTSSHSALPIIILLLIWGSIGLHYNMSPLYRKALFRYFIAHKFFIDDIFQRQVRSIFPAFAIIVQNALLVSACSFAAFSALFTPLGQEAFFQHFPSLGLWGNRAFSIFTWTFLGILLFSFLNIIWLFIAHRKISFFKQITTIFSWPLQLNFILCTIAITCYAAGSGSRIIAVLTILSFLILLLSFILASADTFKFAKSKLLHLAKTSFPYLLVLGGIITWILTKDRWIEVLHLSLNLK